MAKFNYYEIRITTKGTTKSRVQPKCERHANQWAKVAGVQVTKCTGSVNGCSCGIPECDSEEPDLCDMCEMDFDHSDSPRRD